MRDNFPDDIEDYVAYEDKYDREFYNVPKEQEQEQQQELSARLQDVYIEDTTPNGKIVIYYDFTSNSFNYYFNNKNAITYPELEAAAKLFTIRNNCRSLFIESTQQQQQQQQQQEQQQQQQQQPKSNKSSVFASIKSYNKQTAKQENNNNNNNNRDKMDRLDRTKKLGNHFKYVGKIEDFLKQQQEPFKNESKNEVKNESKNESKQPIVKNQLDEKIVIMPRSQSPPGKLLKKSSSKIMPKNNISFAEYKRQVLEPNRKQ